MVASYRIAMGTASRTWVIGSWAGVRKPARTRITTQAGRRHERSFRLGSTPIRLSASSTSGNSNATPKARISSMMNDRYSEARGRSWMLLPEKAVRKCSAAGRVQKARPAPAANSASAEPTNGIA